MAEPFDPYHKWLGIAPRDQPPHHYRLLGVDPFENDREVIDSAANRVMSYLKELATGDDAAHSQRIMNEVMQARMCLLDPRRKAEYDSDLQEKLASRQPPPPRTVRPSESARDAATPSPPAPAVIVATSATPGYRLRSSWRITAVAASVGLLAALLLIAIVFTLSGVSPDETQLANGRSESPTSARQSIDDVKLVEPSNYTGSAADPSRAASGDGHGEDAASEAVINPESIVESSGPANIESDDSQPSVSERTPVTVPDAEPAIASAPAEPLVLPTPEPLPAAEDQENATPAVLERFGQEIAAATTVETRIEAARRMLLAAVDAKEKAPTRFALLVEAHKLAIAAGSAELANEITDCMVRDFTTEQPSPNASVLDSKASILEEIGNRAETSEDWAAVAESALALANQAGGADRMDLARKMASMALLTARKADDDALVRRATLRLVELR